jgi:hypothetical protein
MSEMKTELDDHIVQAIAFGIGRDEEGKPSEELHSYLRAVAIHLHWNYGTPHEWPIANDWSEFFDKVARAGEMVLPTWDGDSYDWQPAVDSVKRFLSSKFNITFPEPEETANV